MSGRWRDLSEVGSPLRTRIRWNPDGSVQVHQRQPNLKAEQDEIQRLYCADRRSSSLWNGADYVHVARWSPEVIEYLRVHYGLDILNKDHLPRIHQLANSNEFLKVRTAPGRF